MKAFWIFCNIVLGATILALLTRRQELRDKVGTLTGIRACTTPVCKTLK